MTARLDAMIERRKQRTSLDAARRTAEELRGKHR